MAGGDMLVRMTANDLDLLGEFIRNQSQDAFTTLVRRHLDLVYCAALRQVRSPQLAEEVAQSVFIDLARNAARLKPDTILAAWLYEVTRREAIDVVRREARRQLREQIATEMNTMNATATDWTHIEPFLDEAMHALDETDRAAVLLRYFENKSLREVGTTLGTSDDAAQKRVSRAVERLREFFAERGVTIGASGLVVVITANAVQAAPVGLALTISTGVATLAGTTLTGTATATAIKTIAMTTLQKTLITVTIATAVGTGIYETRQASTLRTQVQSLQQQQASSAKQIQQLTRDRDEAATKLAALPVQAADEFDEIQQLLKARDDAKVKAKAIEKRMREAGVQIDSMGFDSARVTRDQQASAGSKLAAYDLYAKTAKRLERKVQTEEELGKRMIGFSEIARFERLQAEVELAQVEGRLPITKETEK
jgi:RNA polymerase sigma factor (sigma-70 family)